MRGKVPRMLNARQEQFCMFVAEGKIQTDAARLAGFPAPLTKASQLMATPRIRSRVEELRERLTTQRVQAVARVITPTRDWVLHELIGNVEAAKEARDRGSVNKGLELVGKEIGMFVQRSIQLDSPLQKLPAAKLTELLRLIDETLEPQAKAAPMLTIEATVEATAEPAQPIHNDDATDDGW